MMGEKAFTVLLLASMEISDARWAEYEKACKKWSEKAICAKFEELEDKGLIESGVTSRTGWLTEEGKKRLAQEIQERERQGNAKQTTST